MKQRDLLIKYSFKPSKLLGQNFIIDDNVIQKIADLINPETGELLVEVGPGLGALTTALLERGAHILGVEKDRYLKAILEKEFLDRSRQFKVLEEDILEFDFKNHFGKKKVRVVGNLPYYLTSPLIFRLFEQRSNIKQAILMVQKEVADRLIAPPQTPEYGRLTVAVKSFADVRRLMNVPKKCFLPSPKIDSSVVEFNFRSSDEIKKNGVNPEFCLEIIKAAFSQRRKNLLNCLAHARVKNLDKPELDLILKQCGVDPSKRAEALFLKDFLLICRKLQDVKSS